MGHRLKDAEGLEALIIYGDREGSFPAPFAPDTYFTNDWPGAVVVGEDEALELNQISTRMMRV